MSWRMSTRAGDHPSSRLVFADERRLLSDRLMPKPTLGGGVSRLPSFRLIDGDRRIVSVSPSRSPAFMPSICTSVRLADARSDTMKCRALRCALDGQAVELGETVNVDVALGRAATAEVSRAPALP